jgi:enolase
VGRSALAAGQAIGEAVTPAGHQPGQEIGIALDPATSGLYQDGHYELRPEGVTLTSAALIERYAEWVERYPIISIEDGLAEDDWDGWEQLRARLGQRIQLVGDDIFVTNPRIIQRGIERDLANAVLIKPNQIGTLTETRQALELTQANGWRAVMSHRGGETDDVAIADLAVGLGAGQIKSGAPAHGRRLAKYNRLLEIERALGEAALLSAPVLRPANSTVL